MSLSDFAKKTAAKKIQPGLGPVEGFVRAVSDDGLRMSYGALAVAHVMLGGTPSRLSGGQRGAQLARNLPTLLQPTICRRGGDYHPNVPFDGTLWTDRPVIRVESIKEAIASWQQD